MNKMIFNEDLANLTNEKLIFMLVTNFLLPLLYLFLVLLAVLLVSLFLFLFLFSFFSFLPFF